MALITYNAARHEDLRDIVSRIIQEDKDTVLSLFLKQDLAVEDTTHKWGDKKLKGYRDTLAADINSSVTTLTISAGATKFMLDSTTNNKMYLKIDDEYIGLTSGSGTNTLTVTRGALGTSAAEHTAGADVFFEHISEEGADNERDDSEVASKVTNITQIFRRELKLSGTSQAVRSLGLDAAMANQTLEKLKQLRQQLRVAFVNSNVKYADGDESLRKMAGLPYYATAIDAAGSFIDKAMLESDIATLLDNGANPEDLVLMIPTAQVGKINDMKVARITGGGMQDTSNVIRNNVDKYEFTDAQVQIVRVPEMPRSRYILGDKTKATIAPLKGRSFRTLDIAKKGDSEEKLLLGEYTCEVMNGADCWILRKNLGVPA